jgi:hypothetical protein
VGYDYSNWESYNGFGVLDKSVAAAVLLFVLLQLVFLLYTIINLVAKNKN